MTLAIPDFVVWQDVPGDLALFDARSDRYFALNGSAAAIWREIARGTDEALLAQALTATFAMPAERLAPDVAAFVAGALAQGLLMRTPG